MKETEEIMGMIKEEGAAYFARERGNKVEVGLYLEHIIEERGMKKKDIVRKLNLEESYARKTVWRSANPHKENTAAVCVSPFS